MTINTEKQGNATKRSGETGKDPVHKLPQDRANVATAYDPEINLRERRVERGNERGESDEE